MTAQEAQEIANTVLELFDEQPIALDETGTDRDKLKRVLHEYAKRLRVTRPELDVIKDDKMLPDLVIHRIAEALRQNERVSEQESEDDGGKPSAS